MVNYFVSDLNFGESFAGGDNNSAIQLNDTDRKKMYELTAASFEELTGSKLFMLVLFYLPTCPDCEEFESTFSSIKDQTDSEGWPMHFGRFDVASDKELADRFGIESVPAMGLFVRGGVGMYQENVNCKARDSILRWIKKKCISR